MTEPAERVEVDANEFVVDQLVETGDEGADDLTHGIAAGSSWWPLARGAIAMSVVAGCYLLLALTFVGQLGMADVRIGGLLGIYLGWLGVLRISETPQSRSLVHIRKSHPARCVEPRSGSAVTDRMVLNTLDKSW